MKFSAISGQQPAKTVVMMIFFLKAERCMLIAHISK